jgi:hypothetical protein
MGPKEPWISDDAFGPPLFVRDFATCHIDWDVILQFAIFVSHRSSALFRVIFLIDLVTQFTAVLHVGSLISCHNFVSFFLRFTRRSRPGSSYIWSKIVVSLVGSTYDKVIEASTSRAALSGSSEELMQMLENIRSETKLWKRSQSVNYSLAPYSYHWL